MFCGYCGKQVPDGSLCDCEGAVNARAKIVPESAVTNQADASLGNAVNLEKTPVSETKEETNVALESSAQMSGGANTGFGSQQVNTQSAQPQGFTAQQMNTQNQFNQNQANPSYQQGFNGQYNQGNPQYNQGFNQGNPQYNQGNPQYNQQYNPNNQMYQTQQRNVNVDQYMAVGKNAFSEILKVLMSPVEAGLEFVKSADYTVSCVTLAIKALLSSLFSLFVIFRINGTLFDSYVRSEYSLSMIKGFFITLIFSLLYSAIFAGLIFAVFKILKSEKGFRESLALSAVSAIGTMPVILFSCVVYIFSPTYGFILFFMASLLGLIEVSVLMTRMDGIDKKYLPYVLFGLTIIFFIIVTFIMGRSVSLYLPRELSRELRNLDPSDIFNYM